MTQKPVSSCPVSSTTSPISPARSFSSPHPSIPLVHGNAGHIAQSTRAPQYRMLSAAHPSWHVIALDYRGFGHSTGSPTEEGLIADAAALVHFALSTLQIPPSRILLLGQSLGTAVAAATAEKVSRERGVDLAGVVLVAPFSSLPTMLASYSLGGVVPLLRPLGAAPPLLRMVMGLVADRWTSLDRLAALAAQTRERAGRLRLNLVHGADDWDIPCVESVKIFEAAARASVKEGSELDKAWFLEMRDSVTDVRGDKAFKITWQGEADIVVTHEQFAYGGEISIEFDTQWGSEGEKKLILTQGTTTSCFMRQFCKLSWRRWRRVRRPDLSRYFQHCFEFSSEGKNQIFPRAKPGQREARAIPPQPITTTPATEF